MAAVDPAHAAADASLEAFGREVAETYREAQKTAEKRLRAFLERYEKQDAEWAERVRRDEATEDEWRSWRRGRMLAGRDYRAMLDQVSRGYTHANEVAMAALSGRLPEVYAENYNYGGYQVESAAGVDTSFCLQDASTVQRMLTDSGSYIPEPKVKPKKDGAWNRKLLSSQLTQGVMLGESIPKIARRVRNVTGSNMAAAVRTARTCTTAAENAGRVDSYRRAKGMGIDLKQEWLATLDGRTRSSHRKLDGERAEVGEKFSNGCRYPGDPEGPAWEVYNCRCTLIAAVDGVDYSDGKRWSRLPEGMTYDEWKSGKPAATGARPADRTISDFMDMPGTRRKLDAAGVSTTEARRLLTAQLRDYGVPSGSFRKMSAGDQQRALDAALSRIRRPDGRPDTSADVYSDLTRGQRKDIGRILRKSDSRVRNVYLKNESSLRLVDHDYDGVAHFDSGVMGVRLKASRVFSADSASGRGTTWFHEFGHQIDFLHTGSDTLDRKAKRGLDLSSMWLSSSFEDGAFPAAIRKDVSGYVTKRRRVLESELAAAVERRDAGWIGRNAGNLLPSQASDLHELQRYREHLDDRAWLEANGAPYLGKYDRKGPQEWYDSLFDRWAGRTAYEIDDRRVFDSVSNEITRLGSKANHDVSDLFSGATNGNCTDGWCHPEYVWSDDLLAHEGFAEFFSAYASSPESMEQLKRYLPESSKIFEKMLDVLGGD